MGTKNEELLADYEIVDTAFQEKFTNLLEKGNVNV